MTDITVTIDQPPEINVALVDEDINITISDSAAVEVILSDGMGPTGPKGDTGDPGLGIPVGGTTGQLLTKNSDADYDVAWGTDVNMGLLEFKNQTAPSTPASDFVDMYYYTSGTTPNKVCTLALKDESGTEIIVSSRKI